MVSLLFGIQCTPFLFVYCLFFQKISFLLLISFLGQKMGTFTLSLKEVVGVYPFRKECVAIYISFRERRCLAACVL